MIDSHRGTVNGHGQTAVREDSGTGAALPARAEAAMLTMCLRKRLREAEDLERELDAPLEETGAAAIAELRVRLGRMMTERRAMQLRELLAARDKAVAEVEAAKRVVVGRAALRTPVAPVVLVAAEPDVREPVIVPFDIAHFDLVSVFAQPSDDFPASGVETIQSEAEPETPSGSDAEWTLVRTAPITPSDGDARTSEAEPDTHDEPESSVEVEPDAHGEAEVEATDIGEGTAPYDELTATSIVDSRDAGSVPMPSPSQVPGYGSFDADVFAEALARALGPLIAQRAVQTPYPTILNSTISRAVPADMPSFWATARHLDVLMALIALVLVLAVLTAWLV
jgi:hypothetical protein